MGVFDDALLTIKTTAPKYLKGASDLTIRRRLMLSILQQSGNMLYNVRAPKIVWDVECREARPRYLSGSEGTVYTQTDPYEQLEIGHAEFEHTEVMQRRQQMINTDSPQAIVDVGGRIMERITNDSSKTLCTSFFADSSSGTDAAKPTGIRSFMKTHASAVSTDKILVPSATATYGGKNIGLAALGGTWSANGTANSSVTANDWPEGSGSPEYDYLAPKIFNYSANWGASANTWEGNCTRILRRSKEVVRHTGGEGVSPMVHVLAMDLYNSFRDNLEARERFSISDYAKSLGFPDVLQYEGAVVTTDFDCPQGRGYGINPSELALYSVHDQLFFTDGPNWSPETQKTLFLVGFLGNWRWNPKHCCEYRAG